MDIRYMSSWHNAQQPLWDEVAVEVVSVEVVFVEGVEEIVEEIVEGLVAEEEDVVVIEMEEVVVVVVQVTGTAGTATLSDYETQ